MLYSYIQTNVITDAFQQNHDHAFVASMSDGSIATMHYYKNEAPGPLQSELSWGISSDENKVVLPQPVCGMGLLNNTNDACGNGGNSGNSIVACLRDGTVFVIPVIPLDDSNSNNNNNSITGDCNGSRFEDIVMFKLPQDPDSSGNNSSSSDPTVCYTQGFTAGYIRVRDWGSGDPDLEKKDWISGRLVPVFFHAWPGGVIDCHACGLVPGCLSTRTSRTALKRQNFAENGRVIEPSWAEILALVSSDVIVDLISFLLSLDLDGGSADGGSTIVKAAMECKSLGESEGDVLKRVLSGDNDRMIGLESLSKLINDLICGDG